MQALNVKYDSKESVLPKEFILEKHPSQNGYDHYVTMRQGFPTPVWWPMKTCHITQNTRPEKIKINWEKDSVMGQSDFIHWIDTSLAHDKPFGCAEDGTDNLERSPLTSRSMAWVAHLPSVANGSYGHYYETLIDE